MHPRRTPRLAALLAAAALLATCGAACSAGGADPSGERPSTLPRTPVSTADADGRDAPGGGAGSSAARGAAGGRPKLTEPVALAVTTGREVFVQPSCTPDATGQRRCWHESALPYELDPGALPLAVTAARTDLDAVADSWFVEVEVESTTALSATLASARTRGSSLALTTTGGDLVALAPGDATVQDGRLRLSGLAKPAAYDLVRRLVALAEDA